MDPYSLPKPLMIVSGFSPPLPSSSTKFKAQLNHQLAPAFPFVKSSIILSLEHPAVPTCP